jgi:predicted ArsR family transcriptional regulator
MAARLLADAVDDAAATQAREALAGAARRRGEGIGKEARAQAGPRPSRRRLLDTLVAALSAQGYQPEGGPGELRLRNCPFHALAVEHTQLVCGMNLDLLAGVVDGLALPGARAELSPQAGFCCVRLVLSAHGGRRPVP